MRTRIYVDGYNLYYGCLKRSPHKWLDLLHLFEAHVLPSSVPGAGAASTSPWQSATDPLLFYYTAPIKEVAAKAPDSVDSQKAYHAALQAHSGNRLKLVLGNYSLIKAKAKKIDPKDPKKPMGLCDPVEIWKLEEKKSDVALSLQAYHDALTKQVDMVVIVTNDTDVAPALQMIRDNTEVQIGLVIPTTDLTRKPNAELVQLAHWSRTNITEAELRSAQLPLHVNKGNGKFTRKPTSWYQNPEVMEEAFRLGIVACGSVTSFVRWLNAPSPYFGDASPLALLDDASLETGFPVMEFMRSWEKKKLFEQQNKNPQTNLCDMDALQITIPE